MFAHIFTTRLKRLIRDPQMVFWTLMFPLILGTFFNMGLRNINNSEAFHPVNIAVVADNSYQKNSDFKAILEDVSTGDDRIFNLTATTKENANQLLGDNKIDGYITVGDKIDMTVSKTGINQSILKAFLDNYSQTSSAITSIIKTDPSALQRGLLEEVGKSEEYTKEVSGTSAKPDNVVNYFYTLIAMACMYGGFWGMQEVTDIQANLSKRAARVNVAPVHKLKTFLYSMSASFVIQFAEMLVLLAYLCFGFKIDFGPKTGFVILTTFIGSILGLSFGAFISAMIKKGEGIKVAVLLCVSMAGSFLSGMMMQNVKYIIAQNVPFLSYINPVNLLTDAFYCLYYYDSFNRYALNMSLIGVMIVIFCSATYFIIRRQKYANI